MRGSPSESSSNQKIADSTEGEEKSDPFEENVESNFRSTDKDNEKKNLKKANKVNIKKRLMKVNSYAKSEREMVQQEKEYIKQNLISIDGQKDLINKANLNKKFANLFMGSLNNHVDNIVDTVSVRKKNRSKASRSKQIKELEKGKIDLNTPESILTNVNLSDVITTKLFDKLPSYYQYKLTSLLPKSDQVTLDNGIIRPSSSAFNNEFFAQAVSSYSNRLSEGKFTTESLTKIRKEFEKKNMRFDPWKLKYFEPFYQLDDDNDSLELTKEQKIETDLTFLKKLTKCDDVEDNSKVQQIKDQHVHNTSDSCDVNKGSLKQTTDVIDFKKLNCHLSQDQVDNSLLDFDDQTNDYFESLIIDCLNSADQFPLVFDVFDIENDDNVVMASVFFDKFLLDDGVDNMRHLEKDYIIFNIENYSQLLDTCIKMIKLLARAIKSYMPYFDVMAKCCDTILGPLRDFSERCLKYIQEVDSICCNKEMLLNLEYIEGTIPKIFLQKVFSFSIPENKGQEFFYFDDVRIRLYNTFLLASKTIVFKLKRLIGTKEDALSVEFHIQAITSFSSYVNFCQSTLPVLAHVPEDKIFPAESSNQYDVEDDLIGWYE